MLCILAVRGSPAVRLSQSWFGECGPENPSPSVVGQSPVNDETIFGTSCFGK